MIPVLVTDTLSVTIFVTDVGVRDEGIHSMGKTVLPLGIYLYNEVVAFSSYFSSFHVPLTGGISSS
jgi:hypothetical protein